MCEFMMCLCHSVTTVPDQIGPEPTWLLPAPHNDACGRSGGGASLLNRAAAQLVPSMKMTSQHRSVFEWARPHRRLSDKNVTCQGCGFDSRLGSNGSPAASQLPPPVLCHACDWPLTILWLLKCSKTRPSSEKAQEMVMDNSLTPTPVNHCYTRTHTYTR